MGMTDAVTGTLLSALAASACAFAPLTDRSIAQGPVPAAQGTSLEARWTPSSEAPDGVLSHALEGERHDLFIELARQGDIELVFFGTTETEMWWWPDRGREVWDREFGALKAANFGSQGTQVVSLLWRMQNGELDGLSALASTMTEPVSRGLLRALGALRRSCAAGMVARARPARGRWRRPRPARVPGTCRGPSGRARSPAFEAGAGGESLPARRPDRATDPAR